MSDQKGWAPSGFAKTARAVSQQKVIREKKELDYRLAELAAFFSTEQFNGLDEAEKVRLNVQQFHMQAYSAVLGERIAAFK